MGNRAPLPCSDLINTYVDCMEKHEGVRPDPYEPEWCDAEKHAYLACREALQRSADDKHKEKDDA